MSSVSGRFFCSLLFILLLARHRLKTYVFTNSWKQTVIVSRLHYGLVARDSVVKGRQMGAILFLISRVINLGTERACCFNFGCIFASPTQEDIYIISLNLYSQTMNFSQMKFVNFN